MAAPPPPALTAPHRALPARPPPPRCRGRAAPWRRAAAAPRRARPPPARGAVHQRSPFPIPGGRRSHTPPRPGGSRRAGVGGSPPSGGGPKAKGKKGVNPEVHPPRRRPHGTARSAAQLFLRPRWSRPPPSSRAGAAAAGGREPVAAQLRGGEVKELAYLPRAMVAGLSGAAVPRTGGERQARTRRRAPGWASPCRPPGGRGGRGEARHGGGRERPAGRAGRRRADAAPTLPHAAAAAAHLPAARRPPPGGRPAAARGGARGQLEPRAGRGGAGASAPIGTG